MFLNHNIIRIVYKKSMSKQDLTQNQSTLANFDKIKHWRKIFKARKQASKVVVPSSSRFTDYGFF